MYKYLVTRIEEMGEVQDFLSQSELARYQSFKVEKRRRDYALGRWALKKLLAKETGVRDLKSIIISNALTGAPVASVNGQETELYVSLSHSALCAAAAVSQNPVGIDIERIESRSAGWAEISFTAREREQNSTPLALTTLWAKKEALVKLFGTGLSVNTYDAEFDGNTLNLKNMLAALHKEEGARDIAFDIKDNLKDFIIAVAYCR